MPRLSDIEGAVLRGAGGAVLGTVERVLFHPSEPRAVALMVRPDPVLYVVSRAPGFVPLGAVKFGSGKSGPTIAAAKLPSRKDAQRDIGHDPEATVIWRGMPVVSETGNLVGAIADVEFTPEGAVSRMEVSAGVAGDVAHGRLEVPGGIVRGFDGQSVVVRAEAGDLRAQGGLAHGAARTLASAKAGAAGTAKAAGGAVVDASYLAGHAIGSVASSRAARKARGAWKGLVRAYREGRDDDAPPPERRSGAGGSGRGD